MKQPQFLTHSIIVPRETRERSNVYLGQLTAGASQAGKLLAARINQKPIRSFSDSDLLAELLKTKIPQIFAESMVRGDGSDWNLVELGLLGDISVGVPVEIYDNGHHTNPVVYDRPFQGTLVFTPGALLRNGCDCTPADWNEVVGSDSTISPEGFFSLYERRLLPVLEWINSRSSETGSPAFITVPGLGCGQFAGPFCGTIGKMLESVLRRLLAENAADLPHIRALYFDPYSECANQREKIYGIDFLVRPLRASGNANKPQLCPPKAYEESPGEFDGCELYSIVAWDHVSWPGNDFFIGSRCTDDGVKAAATDSMYRLTGIKGQYDKNCNKYQPPKDFHNWGEVIKQSGKQFPVDSFEILQGRARKQ